MEACHMRPGIFLLTEILPEEMLLCETVAISIEYPSNIKAGEHGDIYVRAKGDNGVACSGSYTVFAVDDLSLTHTKAVRVDAKIKLQAAAEGITLEAKRLLVKGTSLTLDKKTAVITFYTSADMCTQSIAACVDEISAPEHPNLIAVYHMDF